MSVSRTLKRPSMLALHVVVALVLATLLSTFDISSAEPPDFAAACEAGEPFFVTAAYRGQTSRSKRPSMRAPSVLLFRDTPANRMHYVLADFRQVGAVWGLAHARAERAVYASTFHKRGLPYGPEGPGGIYRIDLADGQVSHFVTVPGAGAQQRRASMSNGERQFDQTAARKVGKTALGDLDLSDDESQLFVMNLEDRKIHRYELPAGTPLGSFDHGATGEPWARDARPFGLAFHAGQVYHGVVNAQGVGSSLVAKVYRSLPDGSGMTEVTSLDMTYRRDGIRLRTVSGASVKWGPWNDWVDRGLPGQSRLHNPQPMLTDIAFTPDGTMVIALRDRYSDTTTQWIDEAFSVATVEIHPPGLPTPDVNVLSEEALGFGDILRGQRDNGGYTIGTDPEHFDDTNRLGHGESAMGGLSCIADTDRVVATMYGVKAGRTDVIVGEEGAYWYDVPTGNQAASEVIGQPGSFQSYDTLLSSGRPVWAHTTTIVIHEFEYYRDVASLGDVEALCGPCGIIVPTPTPPAPTDTPGVPTDTPTPHPTDTPVPPSPTATPTPTLTPTREPSPVYLPLLLREECEPERMRADVVLVLDASSSMTGAKIEAAKDAAGAFIGVMDLPDDQVGVVTFNREATIISRLSGDAVALGDAIERIAPSPGTRIDTGLELATDVLAGPERVDTSTAVVIVLTDGIQVEEPERPQDLAATLREEGVEIYVVGLGADVNVEYLERMAGERARLYLSPGPKELTAIYQAIAREIPCSPSVYWPYRP